MFDADEETYALFYYNGHAVGHSEDIYLATVESSLDEHDPTPLYQVTFELKKCDEIEILLLEKTGLSSALKLMPIIKDSLH